MRPPTYLRALAPVVTEVVAPNAVAVDRTGADEDAVASCEFPWSP